MLTQALEHQTPIQTLKRWLALPRGVITHENEATWQDLQARVLTMTLDQLLRRIGPDFQPQSSPPGPLRVMHAPSNISFVYVPAGKYRMGFSAEEEQAAAAISDVLQANIGEMRPTRERDVAPLLVSETPVLNRHIDISVREHEDYPAYLSRDIAQSFAAKWGCRLPSEVEWEYLCRAGATTLFPFGDQLPDDRELERWLSSDFKSLDQLNANGFGLYGLFEPQWCEDTFTVSLEDGAEPLDGSFVIRGGGSYFWPWQDQEWVWCMSAMRSPSSGLEKAEACLRLVRSV